MVKGKREQVKGKTIDIHIIMQVKGHSHGEGRGGFDLEILDYSWKRFEIKKQQYNLRTTASLS